MLFAPKNNEQIFHGWLSAEIKGKGQKFVLFLAILAFGKMPFKYGS